MRLYGVNRRIGDVWDGGVGSEMRNFIEFYPFDMVAFHKIVAKFHNYTPK